MAIRVKTGIFTGVVAAAAIVGTACSGGSNRTDSSLPPTDVLSNLAGVYRKASISTEGKTVTCPDFNDNGENLGSPNSELTINGIVIDTCSANDRLILGPAKSGTASGRYRIVSLAGTEDGNYKASASQIVLTRDLVNGVSIAPAPLQRLVLRAAYNADGTLSVLPIAQPVALKLKGSAAGAFNADGSLNAAAVEPVLDASGSANVIVLPRINDVPQVNPDLSITIGPIASSSGVIDPPGFSRVRGISQSWAKKASAPGTPDPTPAPAPTPTPTTK